MSEIKVIQKIKKIGNLGLARRQHPYTTELKMKEKYCDNDFVFILSNDYDKISKLIYKYMAGVRIQCKYCTKAFRNKRTLNNHYKVIHRIEKNI